MKKTKIKQDEEEVVEQAEPNDLPECPKQYKMLKGDYFVPYDPDDAAEDAKIDTDNYYVTEGDIPTETNLGESLILEKSIWHNAVTAETYMFAGNRAGSVDDPIWEKKDYLPRYVIALDGERKGHLLGQIKNKNTERKIAIAEVSKQKFEELSSEVLTKSLHEILNEVAPEDEDSDPSVSTQDGED